MEFEAEINGEGYRFTPLNNSSVLVSGNRGEYILYKHQTWRCADDLPREMVTEFGQIIDEHFQISHP